MQQATTINTVIDKFNSLILEEKEFAIDIIKKMFSEASRDAISKRVHKAEVNFKAGKVKSGTVADLYNDLEND